MKQNSDLRKIANFFDHYGDAYIDIYKKETEAWYEYDTKRLREDYAFAMIRKEELGTAIDLGCGTGHALIRMKEMGFRRVIGVDISDQMLARARELVSRYGLTNDIELYKVDVQNLPMINSNSVDVCTALGVIEYLRSDRPFLKEVNRILRPRGVAIIQMRNHDCIPSKTSKRLNKLIGSNQEKIWYREHRSNEFASSVNTCGFEIEHAIYSHFYALFPLDLILKPRSLFLPINNFLSKKLEIFSGHRLARWLASMYITKIRKVTDLNDAHGYVRGKSRTI